MIISGLDFVTMGDAEGRQPTTHKERGSVLQRERLGQMARTCTTLCAGNLIEIGCLVGSTSIILAQVAKDHGRKLICVDNWKGGDEYELDKLEPEFRKNVQPFGDTVVIIKGDAHTRSIFDEILKHKPFCFAFSDDGHSYDDHFYELLNLLPWVTGLVAVDDNYLPEVRKAIDDVLMLHTNKSWQVLYDPRLRETWLQRQ